MTDPVWFSDLRTWRPRLPQSQQCLPRGLGQPWECHHCCHFCCHGTELLNGLLLHFQAVWSGDLRDAPHCHTFPLTLDVPPGVLVTFLKGVTWFVSSFHSNLPACRQVLGPHHSQQSHLSSSMYASRNSCAYAWLQVLPLASILSTYGSGQLNLHQRTWKLIFY